LRFGLRTHQLRTPEADKNGGKEKEVKENILHDGR
jgi:hypothetical protein